MTHPATPVNHKQKETLVIIKKWQLEVCNGDECAAAMLNFFEYWHKIKVKHIEEKILKKKISSLLLKIYYNGITYQNYKKVY